MSKHQKLFRYAIFLLILCLIIKPRNSYVLIKFKKFQINDSIDMNEYSPEVLINNLYNKYYSFLYVGNPPQKTEAQLSLDYLGLEMKENICLTSNYYNKNKSLTINQIHSFDFYEYYKKYVIVNETIDFPFFNLSTTNISEKRIPYIFMYDKVNKTGEKEEKIEKEIEGKACIILGFHTVCESGIPYCKSIQIYLKEEKFINSSNFIFNYYNEKEKLDNGGYDASLLMGESPHEYNKEKYKENNYFKSNALFWILDPAWILEYTNYYFLKNGTKITFQKYSNNNQIQGIFVFDLDLIIGTKDYLQSIVANYFDEYSDECKLDSVNYRYKVISCNKNFNSNNFPTIYFYNNDYDYTFELTHKDVFEIRGNRKYFLIIFDSNSNYPWKFGRIFMKKYFFNFESDSRTIGFYKNLITEDKKDKFNKMTLLWMFWALLLIFIGIASFYIGKFIYDKNRKKRANELDDDYEYKEKGVEEPLAKNSNENKLGIN